MRTYYEHSLAVAEENGQNILAMLQSDLGISTMPDGTKNIENTLRYDYLNLAAAESQISFSGGSSQGLGFSCFIFLAPLFLAVGLAVGRHDLRSNAIALRSMNNGNKDKVLFGKIITIFIMSVTIPLLIAFLSGSGAKVLGSFIDFSIIDPINFTQPYKDFPKLLISAILISFIYGALGLVLGLFFKKIWILFSFLVLMFFILPITGTFDPRNIMAVLIVSHVTIIGFFQPSTLGDITTTFSALFWVCTVSLILTSAWYRWNLMDKRVA
jgi:membrane protein